MRLRQIEVFRAVMLARSASAAARLLNVSQPVVSRVLKHTEITLGFALFDRRGGRLRPTPEAEALFAQVQRAFGEIERVDALASNLRRGASGLLRIAATPSLASHLLPEALQAMRSAHPEVACDLWANHTSQIEHDLAAFEIDVGIAIEARERVTLAVVPVTQGEMVLAAPRAWLAGVLRPGGRAWLKARPLIALAEATPLGERLSGILDQAKWEARTMLRVQTYALAGSLVGKGLGCAFLDAYTAAGLNPQAVLVLRLEPRIGFSLAMISSASVARSLLADRLAQCLLAAARSSSQVLVQRLLPESFLLAGP